MGIFEAILLGIIQGLTEFLPISSSAHLRIASELMGIGDAGAAFTAITQLGTETAVCVPCGSALGATWDPDLVERVGAMLGEEAITKACRVLLAPTVNLHRSPTYGRSFECYSEDPLLSGKTAAGFVRGVQAQGVVTTVKHFVGNEAEFERNTLDSVIDPRTLREIYLVPFELAVKEGGALGIMTGYNRVNGTHNTSHVELLRGVLRDEWGFDGFVITDWFGTVSTEQSPVAGVDLEMPGPGRAYGPALAQAVRDGRNDRRPRHRSDGTGTRPQTCRVRRWWPSWAPCSGRTRGERSVPRRCRRYRSRRTRWPCR